MLAFLSRYWWLLVVRGALAILLGVFAITWPLFENIAALVLAFGAVAVIHGTFALAGAITGRRQTPDWWVLLLHGLFGIGVGVLILLVPAPLLVYIVVWAMGLGVLQVIMAVRLRYETVGEWLTLSGMLGIAFGILIMLPAANEGALAVLWLIGIYAVVWGVMLITGGFDIRRQRSMA